MANFLKERRKEEHEWKEKLAKLEQPYELLASSSQSQDKGKASLADNFFRNASSPFIDQITSYRLPDKFKVPDVPIYYGLGDPVEHLERAHLTLHGTPDEVACRVFPLTLAGSA